MKAGRQPGVYSSWNECEAQVKHFKAAVYKSFDTLEDATAFAGGLPTAAGEGRATKRARIESPMLAAVARAPALLSSAPRRGALAAVSAANARSSGFPNVLTPGWHPTAARTTSGAAAAHVEDRQALNEPAQQPLPGEAWMVRLRDCEWGGERVTSRRRIQGKLAVRVQFFDGGARGNPGLAGCGAVLFTREEDARSCHVDRELADFPDTSSHGTAFLGQATNNEAEYEGLLLGLQLALDARLTRLHVHGDSMLVINQARFGGLEGRLIGEARVMRAATC